MAEGRQDITDSQSNMIVDTRKTKKSLHWGEQYQYDEHP